MDLTKVKSFFNQDIVKNIWSFIARNSLKIGIGLLALILLNPTYALLHNLMIIAVLESMALLFSDLGLITFTKVSFLNQFIDDKDGKIAGSERLAYAIIMASIYLGAHILVGLSWFILQFNDVH